jgi:type III pantothenate kinase
VLLVIDVGNTNIHCGLYEGPTLRAEWRMTTAPCTADEFGQAVRGFLAAEGIAAARVTAVACASVIPPMDGTIRDGIRRMLGHETFFVDPARHVTIPILCGRPSEVGADRVANAVAGLAGYGAPLIIVDFGTATTFDVLSTRGEYLGGAISPGLEISLAALFGRTARLPRIDLAPPERAIGHNTAEGMQSGIIYGYAGLVDGLVARIRAELGSPARVIATGGLAEVIAPHASTVSEVAPALTLEGIRLIHGEAGAVAEG